MDYWSFSSCGERAPRSTFSEKKSIEQTEEHLEYERQKNHLLIIKNESLRNANQQLVSSYDSLKMQMNELLLERTALFQKNFSIIYQHNRYKKELQAYRETMCKTIKRNRALLDEIIRNNNLLERFLSTPSHENDQCLYDLDYTTEKCNQIIENKGNEQNSSFRGRIQPRDPLLTPVQEEENYVQETFVIDSFEKRLNIQVQNNNSEERVLSSPQGDIKFKGDKNHKSTIDELSNINILSNDHHESASPEGLVQEVLSCGSSENLVTLKNVRDFFPPVEVQQKIVPFVKKSQPFESINSKNLESNSEEGPLINCQSDNGRQELSVVFSEHLGQNISHVNSVKTEKDKEKKTFAVRNTGKITKKRLSFESKNKRGRKRCVMKILDDEIEMEHIEPNITQDKDEKRMVKSCSRNNIKYNVEECDEKGNIETRNIQILGNIKVQPSPIRRCIKTEVYGVKTRSKTKKDKHGDNASSEEGVKVLKDKASKSNIIGVNMTPCEKKIGSSSKKNKREIQSNGSDQQGLKAGALKKRAKAKTDLDSLNKNKNPKQGDKNLPISTPKSNINSSDSIDFDEISISPINKLKIQISDKNNTILPIKQLTEPTNNKIPARHDLQKNKLSSEYTVLKDLIKGKNNDKLNTLTRLGINDKIEIGKSDIGSRKSDLKADSVKDVSGIQVKTESSSHR